jgi:hypothetical protein
MAEIDTTQEPAQEPAREPAQEPAEDRRCRGRPQIRPDDETRQIIYEAARREFDLHQNTVSSDPQ